jgi:uncharacterized membrane protein YbjE (DUF340 family)
MSLILLTAVAAGVLLGRFALPVLIIPHLSSTAYWVLLIVLFGVGMELGHSDTIWERLRKLPRASLLLPFTSALGSLAGGALAAWPLGLGVSAGMAVGAGFGWYSLSSVILAEMSGPELAALAFLTNVFREIMAIVAMPHLFRIGLGIAAITPGGATTMDTTLAIVSRCTDEGNTVLAFYHGVVLSTMVPILVPLLARMM